ncbi:hypothetical protein KB206_18635 [Microvirga sp. STS02]|uniref:DUF6252 family protein n=1 Tax=Hymenobacter negativus TaxID=2795026 RepID=UPI0018DB396E|nr:MULTISPECIES: DUF6252 family protein [Bacteria]MBH8570915.1 hypothetical protein [Hymenobacter negativus]MBR7210653.1 hypothetical protein [Microvirga sp. STS02]
MFRNLPLYLSLLLLMQCSKCKQDDPPPVNQLPPATQTGANTFDCLLNGQPYTPKGNNGTPNYAVIYDPGFQGGNLQVLTYRYLGSGSNTLQSLSIIGDSISRVGTYRLTATGGRKAFFLDETRSFPCNQFAGGKGVYTNGTLTITRLDRQTGILSGTFEFTLAQPGCDTVKVTQGRFNKKL